MTVEQSPLPVRTAQRTREDNSSLIYAKVREVTGAPDHVIKEAIKACIRRDGTYKVEDVVTTIIADDSVSGSNKAKAQPAPVASGKPLSSVEPASGPLVGCGDGGAATGGTQTTSLKRVAPSSGGPSVSQPKQESSNSDFIDLTRDPQVILGGQVSREEQDISRVLEQSLAESKGGTKRKRGELWFIDPLNPHERKRQDGWPVGLKNVGNTCWFSAVIQSLFHIHQFRDLVLAFKAEGGEEDSSLRRNIRFVSELKQLFALLMCSTRKYVDPSKVVNILKEDSSTTGTDGQQDVSEFQHKLLEWLEDAFSVPPPTSSSSASTSAPSSSSSSSSTPSSSSLPLLSSLQSGPTAKDNPMKRLFLGKYKAEGVNEGKVFHQEVTFGQYPLNVLGFRDIHESLEATMAQGEIETLSGHTGQKSVQEIWFTHLPVVLTFELSRFGFNPQLNQAEKIHQPLFFPQVIYMDRYLECNKSCIRQKREEARKLKEQLSCLQGKLDKFMNYGSSSKRYPLPDVLQYALDFAESSPPTPAPTHPNDVEMEVSSSPVTSSFRSECASQPCQDVSMSSLSDSPSTTPAKHTNTNTNNTTTSSTTTTTTTTIAPPPPQQPPPTTTTATATHHHHHANVTTTPTLQLPPPSSSASASMEISDAVSLRGGGGGSRDGNHNRRTITGGGGDGGGGGIGSRLPDTPLKTNGASSVGMQGSSGGSSSLHSFPLQQQPLTSTDLEPCPREVNESELRVLQDCLRRWRTEVEADVRELQKNISVLEGKLTSLYSEPAMKKSPYHLHAVLVHEGQAVSGHYWSFIHDHGRASWLKVNDITVSQTTRDEMHKESVGGFHNASAYCLMYVDRARLDQGDTSKAVPREASLASLPEDLRRMVEGDNSAFLQEMVTWDNKQRGNASANASSSAGQEMTGSTTTSSVSTMTGNPSTSSSSPPSSSSSASSSSSSVRSPPAPALSGSSTTGCSPSHLTPTPTTPIGTMRGPVKARSYVHDPEVLVTGEQRPGESSIIRPLNPELGRLSDLHAQLSLQATLAAVRDVLDMARLHAPTASLQPAQLLDKAMSKEYQRVKGLAQTCRGSRLMTEDARLTHPVLYLLASGADNNTVQVVLSEQFSLCALLDSIYDGVRRKAQEHYSRLYNASGDRAIHYYEFWHRRYSHYRQAVARFVVGLEAYCEDRYQEALPYFTQAWLHNCEPGLDAGNMSLGGICPAMLAYFRRSCLQKVNESAMAMFESESDMTDALTVMTQQLLPSLAHVLASHLPTDVHTAEEVREKWCHFLEKDLDEEKIERLQDFLSKMFEISGVVQEEPEPVRPSELTRDLHDRYIRAIRKVKDRGELELCMEGS